MKTSRARSSLYMYLVLLGLGIAGCNQTPLETRLVASDFNTRDKALQKLVSLSPTKRKKIALQLIPYLKSEDTLVVSRAGDALGAIGEPAVEPLITSLGDTDVFVRLTAIGALGDIGPVAQSAVPTLTSALKDLHPLVREEAAYALEKINPSQGRS